MLKIEKSVLDNLGFDFEAALKKFASEKKKHLSTLNVPAPAAHHLVESAFAEGGYEVVESEPLAEELPPPLPPVPAEPDPRKAEAVARIKKLSGQKADLQLTEIRAVMLQLLEMLPG